MTKSFRVAHVERNDVTCRRTIQLIKMRSDNVSIFTLFLKMFRLNDTVNTVRRPMVHYCLTVLPSLFLNQSYCIRHVTWRCVTAHWRTLSSIITLLFYSFTKLLHYRNYKTPPNFLCLCGLFGAVVSDGMLLPRLGELTCKKKQHDGIWHFESFLLLFESWIYSSLPPFPSC